MQITVVLTENDLKEDEIVADALARIFGETKQYEVVGPEVAQVATLTAKDTPPEPAEFLPGGDNVGSAEADTSGAKTLPSPKANAANTKTPPAGLELDANGVPWDQSIHSGGKTKMASGPRKGWWVKRKGLPEEEYLARTEELKAQYAGGLENVVEEEDFSTNNTAASFLPGGDNAAPVPQGAAETSSTKFDTGGLTIPVFLQKVGQAQKDGTLTKEIIADVLKNYEVPSLPMLAAPAHKDKLGGIAADLGLL